MWLFSRPIWWMFSRHGPDQTLLFQVQCSGYKVHSLWWRWKPWEKTFHQRVWVSAGRAGSDLLRESKCTLNIFNNTVYQETKTCSTTGFCVPGDKCFGIQGSQENDGNHPRHVGERWKGVHSSKKRSFKKSHFLKLCQWPAWVVYFTGTFSTRYRNSRPCWSAMQTTTPTNWSPWWTNPPAGTNRLSHTCSTSTDVSPRPQ